MASTSRARDRTCEKRHPPKTMKRCPACNLPTTAASLGFVIAGADDDRHVVLAICRRCATSKIPKYTFNKMLARAAVRALANPDRYWCAIFPNAGAARIATGLLGHPAHALAALKALGWGDGIDHAKKTP